MRDMDYWAYRLMWSAVQKQRKEFADWVREKGKEES